MTSIKNSEFVVNAIIGNNEFVDNILSQKSANPDHILWLIQFSYISDDLTLFEKMWTYYNNNVKQLDHKEYCILTMKNFSIKVSKYLIEFCELTDEEFNEFFCNICRMNHISMFQFMYYLKMELFDQNIDEYFKLSLQNVTDVQCVNVFTILFFTGKIDLKKIGQECMKEAINYGNNSLLIWLLNRGAEFKSQISVCLDILTWCNWENFKFYFDFFLIGQEGIKLLLHRRHCLEKLEFLLNIYEDVLEDSMYTICHNDDELDILYKKQKPSYEVFKCQVYTRKNLEKYRSYYIEEENLKNKIASAPPCEVNTRSRFMISSNILSPDELNDRLIGAFNIPSPVITNSIFVESSNIVAHPVEVNGRLIENSNISTPEVIAYPLETTIWDRVSDFFSRN